MVAGYFITGTDTGVGKTLITASLNRYYQQLGYSTIAIKPLASDCIKTAEGLRNKDALLHQSINSIKLPYQCINPFAFEEAIAPHIAAINENRLLTADEIYQQCQVALSQSADYYFIEGAGGWLTPLNARETMADLAKKFQFEIILVVAIKLGCLNHTLLTVEAIKRDLPLAGWIANCVEPAMLYFKENIAYLTKAIAAPLITTIPFLDRAALLKT